VSVASESVVSVVVDVVVVEGAARSEGYDRPAVAAFTPSAGRRGT